MGKLINLEGIDGSGKTTLAQMIAERLKCENISCKFIDKKFSDYSDIDIRMYAETIKKLIWYKEDDPRKFVTDQGWLYLHGLWYSILYENYIKKCEEEILVIDGWFYKIYARFLLKDNYDGELLNQVLKSVEKCDEVYFLNVKPETCFGRRKKFSYKEVGGYDFEVSDYKSDYIRYQTRVFEKMKMLVQKENWIDIKAENASKEELAINIVNKIKKRM